MFYFSITEIGQLEEDILSEVQDFLDKSEDVENNKQKANSNEKERKAEEKRRNKVEEIGRLVSDQYCRVCVCLYYYCYSGW